MNDPDDADVSAKFKDARKALDQEKTAHGCRGFYPVRNPNVNHTSSGMQQGRGAGKASTFTLTKIACLVGKKGHIARFCPQRMD